MMGTRRLPPDLIARALRKEFPDGVMPHGATTEMAKRLKVKWNRIARVRDAIGFRVIDAEEALRTALADGREHTVTELSGGTGFSSTRIHEVCSKGAAEGTFIYRRNGRDSRSRFASATVQLNQAMGQEAGRERNGTGDVSSGAAEA